MAYQKRRFNRVFKKAVQYAQHAPRALRFIRRMGEAKTRYQKRVARDYGGVTTQKDSKNIYRRKSMPSRKRRQWTQFKKKVRACNDDRGTRCVVFNDSSTIQFTNNIGGIPTGERQQGVCCVHLYGKDGVLSTAEPGAKDMNRVFTIS